MKISKLLGIDLTQPSVIGTFSSANQGTSTLMAYFVKELHENGKTVSIISDTKDSVWLTRLKNLDCLGSKPSIIYKEVFPSIGDVNVFEFIKRQKEAKQEIDCVIIDFAFSYSNRDELKKIIEYVKENNMMLFIQKQLKPEFSGFNSTISTELERSDIALSIKRTPSKLSFWKRFLNAFRPIFGLEPFQEPNIKLHLLKNRYGCDNTVSEVFFDFGKINKK
jgi:hypothetical protein